MIIAQLVSDDGRATFTIYGDVDDSYCSISIDFLGYEVMYQRYVYNHENLVQADKIISYAKGFYESLVDHELIKDLDWGDKLEQAEYYKER